MYLCGVFFLLDVVALAASILELTKASRQARTSMWSALITTVLFDVDPDVATAQLLPPDTVDNDENGAVDTDEHIMSKDSSDLKMLCVATDGNEETCENKVLSTTSGSSVESTSTKSVIVNKLCLPSSVYEGTPNLLNTLETSAT